MPEWPRFCELPDDLADPKSAAAAIVPVPYDLTSTWKKGADRGPLAILDASHHIEWFDVAGDTGLLTYIADQLVGGYQLFAVPLAGAQHRGFDVRAHA